MFGAGSSDVDFERCVVYFMHSFALSACAAVGGCKIKFYVRACSSGSCLRARALASVFSALAREQPRAVEPLARAFCRAAALGFIF